jgi:hypothetical protein
MFALGLPQHIVSATVSPSGHMMRGMEQGVNQPPDPPWKGPQDVSLPIKFAIINSGPTPR